MRQTTVEFDGENFLFSVVDVDGACNLFTLHPIGMIELVREMQREKDVMLNWNRPPILTVVRGDGDQ